MCAWIDVEAMVEKYFAVAAFRSGDKQDHFMVCCKLFEMLDAVAYAAADSVERLEVSFGRLAALDFFDNRAEAFERLCGLGIEGNVACEVDLVKTRNIFHDYGASAVWPTSPLTSACPSLP